MTGGFINKILEKISGRHGAVCAKMGSGYSREVILREIDEFIGAVYIPEVPVQAKKDPEPKILFQLDSVIVPEDIELELQKVEPAFSEKLFDLIKAKGLDEVDVYKRAELDRRHFSKIRSDQSYQPTKDTVIRLCLSMKLSLEEARNLLRSSGFSLSRSSRQDIIAEYFFTHGVYDLLLYKEMLYKYNLLND